MTRLSVNVNKVATLRNSRGGDVPNLLKVTQDIVTFGADGITVHPRPDERHITYQDTIDISKMLKEKFPKVEFNVEGYPSKNFLSGTILFSLLNTKLFGSLFSDLELVKAVQPNFLIVFAKKLPLKPQPKIKNLFFFTGKLAKFFILY